MVDSVNGEIMRLDEKLKKFKKKTITKSELEKLINMTDLESVYSIIQENSDILIPITSSKTNGNRRFPIYLKYRIVIQQEDNENTLTAIRGLHPRLLKGGWLVSHPTEYIKYQMVIDKVNEYLFQGKNAEFISRKERSFYLFSEEKLLDNTDIKSLLKQMNLTNEDLQMYDTPGYCFNDYIPTKKDRLVLLICENKDIWFNIRRLMFEDGKFIFFNTAIDGVVYGCGNDVTTSNGLSEYARFMKSDVKFLYWGDIDRAGLDIFLRAQKANPLIALELFLPGYEKMIDLAIGRNIPDSEDDRTINADFDSVYGWFADEYAKKMRLYIENHKRLPQEIISYEVLKKNSKE